MKREKNGQFKQIPFSKSYFGGLKLMLTIIGIGATIQWLYTYPTVEMHHPGGINIVQPVIAYGPSYDPTLRVKTVLTVEEKIREAFPEDPDTAVKIATCESGMNPQAINTANSNGSWDAGLFQINSIHGYSQHYLLETDQNLRVARELYEKQGWTPWVCYRIIK